MVFNGFYSFRTQPQPPIKNYLERLQRILFRLHWCPAFHSVLTFFFANSILFILFILPFKKSLQCACTFSYFIDLKTRKCTGSLHRRKLKAFHMLCLNFWQKVRFNCFKRMVGDPDFRRMVPVESFRLSYSHLTESKFVSRFYTTYA